MLRVKNEERKIVLCLASILDVFAEIVLIDNGSTDSTVELVRAFAQRADRRGKLTLCSYPFDVARCGEEHRSTPADSVHSLAYYYNWCLSKCRRSRRPKVDADMGSVDSRRAATPEAVRRLSPLVPTIIEPSVQTMYHSPDGRWFLSTDEIHREPRLFPNTSTIRFHKAKHSEYWARRSPPRARYAKTSSSRLKDTTEDEFLHWTDRRFPTDRKQQEWRNFNLVKSGAISDGRLSSKYRPVRDLHDRHGSRPRLAALIAIGAAVAQSPRPSTPIKQTSSADAAALSNSSGMNVSTSRTLHTVPAIGTIGSAVYAVL